MNKFKVFFISVFLISTFFFVQEAGAVVQAKSTQELEALIKSLQLQIEQLQKQLSQIEKPASTVWCHNFNINLKYGDKGDEVEVLQVVLEKEGFKIDNSEKKPFATFGEFTASALVGFQDKYYKEILAPLGLERGTGFAGKSTREVLNKVYGCETSSITKSPVVINPPIFINASSSVSIPITPEAINQELGLVAYWKFDEGAGNIAYDSAGINNGKIYNASWLNGVYGKALELKDKGVVGSIPDSFDNSISDSFTITSWVYWYGPNEYNRSSYIFDGRSAGAGIQRYGFYTGIYKDTERVFLQLLCPPDDNAYMTVVSLSPISRNTWTSITGVFDLANGKLSLYINGVLDNSVSVNHAYCKALGSPAIGNNRWASGDGQYAPFNGIIDELKIYSNKNIISNEKYITVFYPNGGETWNRGKKYEIKWECKGATFVNISLKNVGNNYYSYIVQNVPCVSSGSQGSYSWTIPESDDTSDKLSKIRVESMSPSVFDESDQNFTITKPNIGPPVITSISISEGAKGSTVDLTLNGYNFLDAGYFSGCGISPVSDGGFSLVSCNQISDTKITARFSISSNAEEGMRYIKVQSSKGQSNSVNFKVISPYITVVSPNGGEVWTKNNTYFVKLYCSKGISKAIDIWLLDKEAEGGTVAQIASSVTCVPGDTSQYQWTIPSFVYPRNESFKVYTRTIDGSISDESDNYFSISDGGGAFKNMENQLADIYAKFYELMNAVLLMKK